MLCIRNCLNQRREVLCKTAHKGPEKPSLSVASVPDGALFTIAQLSYDCRPILKVCAMPDYSSLHAHSLYLWRIYDDSIQRSARTVLKVRMGTGWEQL